MSAKDDPTGTAISKHCWVSCLIWPTLWESMRTGDGKMRLSSVVKTQEMERKNVQLVSARHAIGLTWFFMHCFKLLLRLAFALLKSPPVPGWSYAFAWMGSGALVLRFARYESSPPPSLLALATHVAHRASNWIILRLKVSMPKTTSKKPPDPRAHSTTP